MADFAQLEVYIGDLSTAITSLITQCQRNGHATGSPSENLSRLFGLEAPTEAHRARESALVILTKLQIMLAGPTDLLQQMTIQTQLLACIRWLGEFQVPACIPLDGSALMKDVSELIDVPENQLGRIVRMAATCGFLREPEPGHITHSALSASFVTNPSYLDAAMFLAETAAPAALDMVAATKQRLGSSEPASQNVVFDQGFFSAANKTQLRRLQRQWQAYLRHGMAHLCDITTDFLTCLEPLRMGNASIVEVGARSAERAMALVDQYPTLHFTVQLSPASTLSSASKNGTAASKVRHPRIRVQHRVPGTPQPIQDAMVYIINFPVPEPGVSYNSPVAQISAELRAHLAPLRMNRSATIVLTAPSLPERGNVAAVGVARIRDLSLLQLANEQEVEMSDLLSLLNGVGDGEGRLVLVNEMRSAGNHGAVALEVKYQSYTDR
uniref:Agnestins biosynthesis cluster transcriptional coactivator AgnL9 n=1 Tax=Paecilomyces divaricatus TaxID=644132 RepID=AGN9_PAEDI|nr:RecName: Full=Agnestins biosynthesis cluster transcriptional coactivator AgnL9; AltName: Full=Agnestins biosynthesis cluster protein L9 [Paecilomyces divaricatus]QBG38879.1 transcriptional coactivator [Paecilomyces divaricatus]